MMDDLEIFNMAEYETQPERARHSLPNLEDDQAELQNEINRSIQGGADKTAIQSTLQRIASSLAKRK